MPDPHDDIPENLESLKTLLPPDEIPHAIPRAIGFIGTEIVFRDLLPFVESRLKAEWGDNWRKETVAEFKKAGKPEPKIVNGQIKWDLVALLRATVVCRKLFRKTLTPKSTGYVEELRHTRDEIMHNDPFTREIADRALDTMILLIRDMNGGEDTIQKLTTLRQWIGAPTTAEQRPEKKKDAEYYFSQGIVNFHESNYREAIKDYTKAIELDPALTQAYNNRGIAKAELKDYQGEIEDCDKAIEIDPKNAYAYNNRGAAKSELGYYQEAIEDFNQAVRIEPNDTKFYYNRGIAKKKLGYYQEAIKDYDKAIELNPNDVGVYSNRGHTKHLQGNNEEAIEDFDKAIELDPNNALAYAGRGLTKFYQGDNEGALKDFTQAIKLDPIGLLSADIYNNRGNAKQRARRNYQGAIEDYDKAIDS